jgi:hypothetical protein
LAVVAAGAGARRLLCLYSDHTLILWDTHALWPGGAHVAAAELARRVRPLAAVRFSSGLLRAMAVLPPAEGETDDGGRLVVAGDDGVVRLWHAHATGLAT